MSQSMTLDHLLAEGHRLARPTVLLCPGTSGEPFAYWHEGAAQTAAGPDRRCWITILTRFLPDGGAGLPPCLRLETDRGPSGGSLVEVAEPTRDWPGEYVPLVGRKIQLLPPVEVLFVMGDNRVGRWLADNDWTRDERYNDNFRDRELVHAYERAMMESHPFWLEFDHPLGGWALLGGWHVPGADDDWYDLLDHRLLVLTLKNSEPWVEGWQCPDGSYRVIERIT